MPHPVVGEEDLVPSTGNNIGQQQPGGQGGDVDDGDADLEGPFLTLDEWMRAEERREARQRRLGGGEGGSMGRNHKEDGGGLGGSRRGHGGHGADFSGDDEGTFALTSTGHAESSSPADPKKRRRRKKKPSHGDVAVGGHQHQHHKHQHHKHQEHQQPQMQGQGADHETTGLDSSLSMSSFGQQDSQSSSLPEDFKGSRRLPSDSYARRSKIDTLKRERDAMRRTMARSELDLEPEGVAADTILRRYQFSVRVNEGLEPSLNKDSGLASISSAPQTRSSTPLFPRGRPPSAPSLAPLPAQRPSAAPPHGVNAPSQSRPTTGAPSIAASRPHHQPILLPLSGSSLPAGSMLSGAPPAMLTGVRSQSPSGGGTTPDLGIGFYEVKIAARDAAAPVDYTHDYRRFSYTDLKLEPNGHTPEGSSTIDPNAMTEWLLRVFPRNQDDAYPMFLLCKDVLRKYHLKEYRYVVKREETYIKRVKTLQMAVEAAVAKQQAAVTEAENETRRLQGEVLEKDGVISRQAALLDEAERVREELERMKEEKRRHDETAERLHAEFIEASKKAAQAMSLEGELGALSAAYEHQLEDMSVLERMKNMLESSQKATKALYAEQRLKLDEVERAKKAVEMELVAVMEKFKELDLIRGMTAQEVCESWPFDAEEACKKSEVLKLLAIEGHLKGLTADDVIKFGSESMMMMARLCVKHLRNAAVAEAKEHREKDRKEGKWLEVLCQVLGGVPTANGLLNAAVRWYDDEGRTPDPLNVEKNSPLWGFLRHHMEKKDINSAGLAALELLSGVDEHDLRTAILSGKAAPQKGPKQSLGIGAVEPDAVVVDSVVDGNGDAAEDGGERFAGSIDSLKGHENYPIFEEWLGNSTQEEYELFQKWKERYGGAAALKVSDEELDEEEERRKKHGLFDMVDPNMVDPYTVEDTLGLISSILDFKAESDFANEETQRPRVNMVKCIRSFMTKTHNHHKETESHIEKLCASLLQHAEKSPRIRYFAVIAGVAETNHWTERSVCFLLDFLHALMILDDPQTDIDPSERGDNWDVYKTWIGLDESKTVRVDHFLEALGEANDGGFGFGEMGRMADPPAIIAPAISESDTEILSLDSAVGLVLDAWFEQFDECKDMLKKMFQDNDVDHDEVLEITEFIALLKKTPMRIRQHDAINMFHELAGPDDTMDEDEFSELLTFYKFNVRTMLSV